MEIKFTKMHGLGNDFVVIDGIVQDIELKPDQIRLIADRHFGIGCDQVLLVGTSDNPEMDVRYRIFNASGEEVEQCGNGVRCIADYLFRRGVASTDVLTVDTINGVIKVYKDANDSIRVNMGVPQFEPSKVPLRADTRKIHYSMDLPGQTIELMALSMGNPHAVFVVDDIEKAPVHSLSQAVQAHEMFPKGVNVGFMQVLDREHIRIRVYERGVGETLACGSGACAAVVAGCMDNRLANEVDVGLNGGHLTIAWEGEGNPVWMTGPATTVYEGKIEL